MPGRNQESKLQSKTCQEFFIVHCENGFDDTVTATNDFI